MVLHITLMGGVDSAILGEGLIMQNVLFKNKLSKTLNTLQNQ